MAVANAPLQQELNIGPAETKPSYGNGGMMCRQVSWVNAGLICLFTVYSLGADAPGSAEPLSSELLMRHPQAKALLQEVSLPDGKMTLYTFQKFLNSKYGLNVVFDEKALADDGVELEKFLPVPPLKNVCLLNAVHHFLKQAHCKMVEEPHRLVIVSQFADPVRTRVLFQVEDLVSPNPKFDPEKLRDPIFDRNETHRLRIDAKLKQMVSWKLEKASLKDIVAKLRTDLNENVLIQTDRVEEESVDPAMGQFSCNYQQMPLGDILRWVLDAEKLDYIIQREAIVITTQTESTSAYPLRIYPVRDLIFREDLSREKFVLASPQWNGPGLGWLGGYGSGFYAMGASGPFAGSVQVTEVGGQYYRLATPSLGVATSIAPAPADRLSDTAHTLLNDIVNHTGGQPYSPWSYFIDGEGAMLAMYYPSLSLIVSQTEQVHSEISNYLQQLRTLQAKHGIHPDMLPMTAGDAASRPDKAPLGLISVLMEMSPGHWKEAPKLNEKGWEGGSITYDKAHYALHVRQTSRDLDEIAGILVQLRRHRYELFQGARPPETGATGRQLPLPALNKSK